MPQSFIDWFLSLRSVQARLKELGWKPPKVETRGGGGPGAPRPPN